jgi:hypothetical protein
MRSTQCLIERDNAQDVCWIPAKFAVVGKWLRINGQDGWQVIEVYDSKPYNEVGARSRDWTKHRKVTDI